MDEKMFHLVLVKMKMGMDRAVCVLDSACKVYPLTDEQQKLLTDIHLDKNSLQKMDDVLSAQIDGFRNVLRQEALVKDLLTTTDIGGISK